MRHASMMGLRCNRIWRINFGNGQIQGYYDSLGSAMRDFAVCVNDGYGFVEKYIEEDFWERVWP